MRTKKQVWSFVGLANCYWKFIPHFSKVVSPLLDLIKDI